MNYLLVSLLLFPSWIHCLPTASSKATSGLELRRYRTDSFKSPRAGVRWRHWIQDACIEDGVLASDVAEMAKVGSEGLELLSYQSYGQRGPTLEDPTYYSYGAEQWNDVLIQYADEARKHGMFLDWAMGPNQAAGTPYPPDQVDAPGFNTELVMGRVFLTAGTKWNGTLPEPELVRLTGYDGQVNFTAPVTHKQLEGLVAVQILPTDNQTSSTLGIDWSTLQNLHDEGTDGRDYTAPQGEDTLIIAFYSRRNGYPEAVPGFEGALPNKPGSWGSYVHDHFSIEGAEKAIQSNQQHILSAAQNALNKEGTGVAMWTDSNEFRAQLYWTQGLAERFQQDHNYSIYLALPVLFGGKRPFGGANTPSQVYDYNNTIDSERFRNDFKQTLTNAYLDYGKHLTNYARTIGLKYSDQPGYNFPLDVGAASTVADIPECESLGQPSIDAIRQFSGGVNLAGRNIFSSEMGAGRFLAYESQMIQLIQDARLAFAGGVNQIILHGYPSSTNYVNTTWPGLTPFVYEFSEMHGPRQPAWQHYDQYMEMFGREMWVLRKGTPKIDVAILRYGWDLDFDAVDETKKHVVFKTDDLTRSGYSYEYVSSYALGLEGVEVDDGVLMPAGPAYKALVLNRARNLTVSAAHRVFELAHAGLPVVVLGDVPDDIPGYDRDGSSKMAVQSAMQDLLQLTNVAQVDEEAHVSTALEKLGASASAKIYSGIEDYPPVVRRRHDKDVELYYIFNQGGSSKFSIGFETPTQEDANVFVLDQVTGETRSAAQWHLDVSHRINMTFTLATNQSMMFAVTQSTTYQNATALPRTVVSAEDTIQALALRDGSGIELRSFSPGVQGYALTDGAAKSATFSLCGKSLVNLTSWNLTLQSWTATSNLSDVATVKTNSSFQLNDGLVPWDVLPGQYNTSGVGLYTTTFSWSGCDTALMGAELRQPSIFHTQRVWLNGQMLPLIDPVNPRIDITEWLRKDTENELMIEVASPLLNALNAFPDDEIESVGYNRARKLAEGSVKRGHQKYGLTGPVEIVPFAKVLVQL
ncbi:hypothetical protein PMZ80_001371 [Knufia obscura]|uniref:Secreted protein n=1 Tax=Knufia obscura TaxID=1635080 RepID=A0ABR0S439_9EURO|nr:hypothetical protein PMZ80_001371 [Knufia obscura]